MFATELEGSASTRQGLGIEMTKISMMEAHVTNDRLSRW
jgi:hypothetical protein